MPLCQIAISTKHLKRSHWWYRRALGFLAAGEHRHIEEPGAACVPDLPECWLDVWWLVGRDSLCQLELMEFQRPGMRSIPDDWRPSDLGYSTIGLHVEDFDEALARIARLSGRLLSAPIGGRGQRRVCLRDPDGVLLELMEDDLIPAADRPTGLRSVPTALRFVTLSVPDLDVARRFWVEALGLQEADVPLHEQAHETLWGLGGACRRSTLVLQAGGVFVELAEYSEPAYRARPAGYLLSDQGILNVAFGSQDRATFDRMCARIRRSGFRANSSPWTVESVATVVYLTDGHGFSVELLHVEPTALEAMGFTPAAPVASVVGTQS